jgi:hypothetical protein
VQITSAFHDIFFDNLEPSSLNARFNWIVASIVLQTKQ